MYAQICFMIMDGDVWIKGVMRLEFSQKVRQLHNVN